MARQTFLFDIETNGFLHQLDRIHSLCITEFETGKKWSFRNNDEVNDIDKGVRMLEKAERVVGHNILGFDLPAIHKVFPDFCMEGAISDTLVIARALLSDIEKTDLKLYDDGLMPGDMIKKHSLEAWGHRLELHKGDFSEMMKKAANEEGYFSDKAVAEFTWATWRPEMQTYCENDVDVTFALYTKILERQLEGEWEEPLILEHQIADQMVRMEENGFFFNKEACEKLVEEIRERRGPLEQKCKDEFQGRFIPAKKIEGEMHPEYGERLFKHWDARGRWWAEVTTTKKNLNFKDPMRADRTKDALFCEVKFQEFSPGSRQQVRERLMELGWKPDEFTEIGNAKVNDDTLKRAAEQLPIATSLAELFMLNKRLSQMVDGKQAWLNHYNEEDGKVHTSVSSHGTVTGRASHFKFNISQVPKVVKTKKGILYGFDGGWGYECRDLFYVPSPWVLMGCDLAGIELRCLAHYLAEYDGGAYAKELLEGDIHTVNQTAAGLESRDMAKTFIYAFLYSAGDVKIGSIVAPLEDIVTQGRIGKALKARFLKQFPALNQLIKRIKREAKRGWITGLDGRKLFVRHQHAALNTLLQSAMAIISKKWLVLFEEEMENRGYGHSWDEDFAMLAWTHDEMQVGSRPEISLEMGIVAEEMALEAGIQLGVNIATAAEHKLGNTWAETH